MSSRTSQWHSVSRLGGRGGKGRRLSPFPPAHRLIGTPLCASRLCSFALSFPNLHVLASCFSRGENSQRSFCPCDRNLPGERDQRRRHGDRSFGGDHDNPRELASEHSRHHGQCDRSRSRRGELAIQRDCRAKSVRGVSSDSGHRRSVRRRYGQPVEQQSVNLDRFTG